MNYKLDENGKFSGDNELIQSINEWYDKDEYDKIVQGILEVPREIWSTDLRRYLISAYNNLRQYDNAHRELDELKPLCDTPELKAAYFYLTGYIYYGDDREMLAVSYYNEGRKADPDNEGGYGFDALIEECRGLIDKQLEKLGRLAERVNSDIKEYCSAVPESEKRDISEEEFTMYLGFLSGMRKIPGIDRPIGFDKFFKKFEGGDRECVLEVFRKMDVTDRESFREMFTSARTCNMSLLYNDVLPYLAGKPSFDIGDPDDEGREAFLNAASFMEPFARYLPKAGILAWDISEKVTLARLAYSCDMIGNTDYATIMLMLTDDAREKFSSFEEYMRSLVFGLGVFVFHIDGWSIPAAMDIISQIMPMLLNSPLPTLKWLEEED